MDGRKKRVALLALTLATLTSGCAQSGKEAIPMSYDVYIDPAMDATLTEATLAALVDWQSAIPGLTFEIDDGAYRV